MNGCRPPGEEYECTCRAECGNGILESGEECDVGQQGICAPGQACHAPGTMDECTCISCVQHPFGDVTGSGGSPCPGPPDTSRSGCGTAIGIPDIAYVLTAFGEGGDWDTCYPNADICPCGGDGSVGLQDVVCVVRAFASDPMCPSDCSCHPCGNNLVEPGEVCDGTDDDACPSACFPPDHGLECLCP